VLEVAGPDGGGTQGKRGREATYRGCAIIKKGKEYLMEILSDRWNLLPLLNG